MGLLHHGSRARHLSSHGHAWHRRRGFNTLGMEWSRTPTDRCPAGSRCCSRGSRRNVIGDRVMSVTDLTRLQATLGSPALGRLREALRRRLELGRELVGHLTLRDATPAERQACDDLFARRPTQGRSLMIDLDELATLLREAGVASDLAVAVETLTGAVAN